MRLISVETGKLEEFFEPHIPLYAVLSHTWGPDHEELSFHDVQNGNITKSGIGRVKFDGCCKQARADGLHYTWIDTCCIDKTNSTELSEAINSMFRWYRNATHCYVYLSDVPAGADLTLSAFKNSRWFQRGWTLQELIAPRDLRFYGANWSCLGARRDLAIDVEEITGIPRPFQLGVADLREASIAQRMSWAAKRVTKRQEDLAYCLLGIFDVNMPMIYGEGDKAFIRLQEEIMRRTSDDSILAWGFDPAALDVQAPVEAISDGVLASSPVNFANCRSIVSTERNSHFDGPLQTVGGSLQFARPLHTSRSGRTFVLLHCHPEGNADMVVGISVHTSTREGSSVVYMRLPEQKSTLFAKATKAITRSIRIRIDRESASASLDRKFSVYVYNALERDIKLVAVVPPASWDQRADIIRPLSKMTRTGIQRVCTKFRCVNDVYDFVIVLEFIYLDSKAHLRYHIMMCSRSTDLETISENFDEFRPEAPDRHSASNGRIILNADIRLEIVGTQEMFVLRFTSRERLIELGREESGPTYPTTNATHELEHLELVRRLIRTFKEDEELALEIKSLDYQIEGIAGQ
jgi:hypothetical protein